MYFLLLFPERCIPVKHKCITISSFHECPILSCQKIWFRPSLSSGWFSSPRAGCKLGLAKGTEATNLMKKNEQRFLVHHVPRAYLSYPKTSNSADNKSGCCQDLVQPEPRDSQGASAPSWCWYPLAGPLSWLGMLWRELAPPPGFGCRQIVCFVYITTHNSEFVIKNIWQESKACVVLDLRR